MKKCYLILSFLLACLVLPLSSLQAQSDRPNFKLGAKAGLNLFFLPDDAYIQEADAALGPEVGIFARIGESIYVQPEVNFVSHNTNLITNDQPRAGERDQLVVRYLRVPVLLGYRTDYDGFLASEIRFMIGPSFAYAFDVKDNNLNIQRSDITKAQFALNGGVGFELWLLNLDLMYHHGFTEMFNRSDSDSRGRAVSLTVGAAF
ncbi:porin family protein [Pontibacter sp. H249]|uniref:porin family protein n=1 Tax=Pontibacter sp. H249 TaxID=3133420 RepID=UPI0030BF49BE